MPSFRDEARDQSVSNPVGVYFRRLLDIRATGGGTAETSYHGALEALLNAVGQTLRPKVISVPQLARAGAGHPDFGLYTATQCQKGQPKPGQPPERGVVEVKGVGNEARSTADASQVTTYWATYHFS